MENKMGVMPMKKLLASMSVPIMLSMLIQACYNIVDSMFVAHYSQTALAAVSLAFPVQMLIIAVSVGTAIGVNSLLSRRLGEKRMAEANQAAAHGIALAVLSTAVFALAGGLLAPSFAALFTESEMIASQASVYIRIVTIFSFGVFVQIVMERIMQATGNPVYNMVMQGIGALVNIILDPIFIFGLFGFPEMGVQGAAIATVAGQILAMALGAWIIHKKIDFLDLTKFRFSMKICRDLYAVGFPAIIMQSVASVMTLGMNMILLPYSELAISVFSIYAKLQQFVFMPVMGMNSALIAIAGYNFGAGKKQRILDAARYSLIAASLIMIGGTLVFQAFPQFLLSLFSAGEEMLTIGIPALRIISLSFLFAGVSIVLCSVFQALGNGMISLWVSLGRQLILVLPLAYLLAKTGGLQQLWFAFVIAEGLCVVFSLIQYRKVKTEQIDVLPD